MTFRGPYLLSGLGHAVVMALLVAAAGLGRGPIVQPPVMISLGTLRTGSQSAVPDPAPGPALRVEEPPVPVEPEPVQRPVEEPVKNAPPERRPGAADPMGMQPPPDEGMVSKIPGETKPVPAGTAPETVDAPVKPGAGSGRRGVGAELDGEPGAASGYLSILQERVGQAWQPPPGVGRPGQVRTVVRFSIPRRGGDPMQLEIESSSQVSLFDRAAMRAILDAAPLPPLPSHLELESIGIRFTFYQDY